MTEYTQGDIIKISGFKHPFLVISKNAFIKSTGLFHVCPVFPGVSPGPVHISVTLVRSGKQGTVLCEQLKLVDPIARGIAPVDRISYAEKMEVSDAIQGIFEYD